MLGEPLTSAFIGMTVSSLLVCGWDWLSFNFLKLQLVTHLPELHRGSVRHITLLPSPAPLLNVLQPLVICNSGR